MEQEGNSGQDMFASDPTGVKWKILICNTTISQLDKVTQENPAQWKQPPETTRLTLYSGGTEDVFAQLLVVPCVALHPLAAHPHQVHLLYLHDLEVERESDFPPVIHHSTPKRVTVTEGNVLVQVQQCVTVT